MAEARGKNNSAYAEAWRRLKKNKVAMVSMAVIALLILMAVFADVIVDYDAAITQSAADKLAKPSAQHWFGCDGMGRDLCARSGRHRVFRPPRPRQPHFAAAGLWHHGHHHRGGGDSGHGRRLLRRAV